MSILSQVFRLMEKTGMTYEEAYEELSYQAECENDRRRDEACEEAFNQSRSTS